MATGSWQCSNRQWVQQEHSSLLPLRRSWHGGLVVCGRAHAAVSSWTRSGLVGTILWEVAAAAVPATAATVPATTEALVVAKTVVAAAATLVVTIAVAVLWARRCSRWGHSRWRSAGCGRCDSHQDVAPRGREIHLPLRPVRPEGCSSCPGTSSPMFSAASDNGARLAPSSWTRPAIWMSCLSS